MHARTLLAGQIIGSISSRFVSQCCYLLNFTVGAITFHNFRQLKYVDVDVESSQVKLCTSFFGSSSV